MMHRQNLHAALQTAIATPLEADCRHLCRLMDECLTTLSDADCLQLGGDAIALIAEVLFLKMQHYQPLSMLDEASQELEDHGGFPVLDDDDDRWERHTMSLNLDDDEEDWETLKKPRSISETLENTQRKDSPSIAAPVPPKRVLQMLKALAGEEDPAAWSIEIAQWLKRQTSDQPISVSQLQRSMRKLSIIELWMGLLLGGFTLEQRQSQPQSTAEQQFYRDLNEADIWIIRADEGRSSEA